MRQSMNQLENIHNTEFSCFSSVRVSRVAATLEGPAAIQGELEGLEKWADGSLIEERVQSPALESWTG